MLVLSSTTMFILGWDAYLEKLLMENLNYQCG